MANEAIDSVSSAQAAELDEMLLARFIPMSGIQAEHLRELCGHAQILKLGAGETLQGDPARAATIYYVVDGTLNLSGGRAPEESVTGGARNARFALIGLEDQNCKATADADCKLLLVDRAKVSTLLIFAQSTDGSPNKPAIAGPQFAGLLLKSGLFSRIPPSNIERLGELIEPLQVARNQMVVEQDGEGDYYYIIKQGRCEVLRRDPDGTELHLANLGPGDSFGEEALISGSRRNASIRMIEDGVLLRLTRDYFVELISEPLLQAVSHERAGDLIATGARWIDVRLSEEFERDGLQYAVSMPLAELRNRCRELDPEGSYITYCNTGRRSQAGAFLLSQRGLSACYLATGISRERPEPRGAEAIRQELPELQAQLVRVNQELEAALQGKAAADAAQELGARDSAQQQAKSDADERLMRLTVEAHKASELLDCAKEQKRSLEHLVREAQAEAESRRRQAAAQCEHLRKHAEELLKGENLRLEQCYENASAQLKSIEQARAQAEAEFEAQRQRLEEQFAAARDQMASEADKIRIQLEQAKRSSEQQAEQIRMQHSQREQDLRTRTEAQLREERAHLEMEFAETIATQEKARHDLEMAETARQSAKREAQRIQKEILNQSNAQQERDRTRHEAEGARLQAAHEAAQARLNQARQRLADLEIKRIALSEDQEESHTPDSITGATAENLSISEEFKNADQAVQVAEQARGEAARAQQHNLDMVATTRTREGELRLQLYEEMEEWAAEEEKQSKTDVERALKYAAEMQRIQNQKQLKDHQSKAATEDLFSDLKQALDGNLQTDPFDDYLHEQLVAEEKARLVKSARDEATEKKYQAQQALAKPDTDKH